MHKRKQRKHMRKQRSGGGGGHWRTDQLREGKPISPQCFWKGEVEEFVSTIYAAFLPGRR
jgi:hypothetical protein